MIFAVDFDGTLVENAYPNIGYPHKEVIEFFKDRQKKGDVIILWTCRTGKHLEDAVNFISLLGLTPDYVNENAPWDKDLYPIESRKIGADYYIDDKAISVYNIAELTRTLERQDSLRNNKDESRNNTL